MFLSCSKVIQFVICVVSFYSRYLGKVFLYNDMCIIRHFYYIFPCTTLLGLLFDD